MLQSWLTVFVAANSLVAADLSGTWTGTLRSGIGESQICLSLLQHDQELTGAIAYEHDARYAEISGPMLRGDRVEFEVVDDVHGKLRFSLILFDDDRLVGEEKVANRAATVALSKYRPMLGRGVDAGLPVVTVLHTVQPEYTAEARAAGIQGTVTLDVDIQTTGTIGPHLKVVQGLGFGLDEKAIECVRKWRFSLPRWDCQPTKSHAKLVVTFRL
jgi:TonB family protein